MQNDAINYVVVGSVCENEKLKRSLCSGCSIVFGYVCVCMEYVRPCVDVWPFQ